MTGSRIVAIIPARMGSSRLPGKPLADICGRPMIIRVIERVHQLGCCSEVVVATDSREILECVRLSGYEAVLTSAHHPSGTDRIAEAALSMGFEPDDVVVNVQGDQPFVKAEMVHAVVNALVEDDGVSMSTVACPVSETEARNPNRVKVVLDNNSCALFFSRSLIPFDRDGVFADQDSPYLRHLGIYAYRMSFLQEFVKMPMGRLEAIEKLEQLRALENGFRIAVRIVPSAPVDVDTEDDLEEARRISHKESQA